MTHILENKNLEIHIEAPGENYSCSRFDWTGKISQVKFKGVTVTTAENTELLAKQCIGKGFYNEFGIETALGFGEAAIGGWFHKIGVGLLKKEDQEYLFHKSYTVRPAKFSVTSKTNKVVISCKSETVNGYSYVLRKEIELHPSSFSIYYSLKNTGEKDINTDEYTHNFMAINKASIGKDYVLSFPFTLKPTLFKKTVNTEQKVDIRVKEIKFNDTPKEQFFFSNLTGNESENAAWNLVNLKSKIGVKETGDFKTNKVNLWGWKHVISPELFINLGVKPGKSFEWSRTYEVFKINS